MRALGTALRNALVASALLLPLLTASEASAHAEPAHCMVRLIHALRDGEGIDPQISTLRPYLQREAFAQYKKFSLLEKKDFVLEPKGVERIQLPNGRQATLTYVDHVERPDGKHRLRLRLEIENPGNPGKVLDTTFVLDEGGVVLQAGQKHQGGLLVLGFSCGSK